MGVAASRTLSVAGPTDLSDITFRIVDQIRYPDILELLYANFHTDEPISRALKLYDGVHRVPAVDEYTLSALKENLSLMAVDPITNKVLGVAINGLYRRDRDFPLTLEEKTCNIRNDKFKHIITLLHKVNQKDPRIFEDMETQVLFDIKMVTTDKLNRRGGLGTDLLRRSVELARDMGYRAAKTEATGVYSRKAFERLGFTVRAEFKYSDYEYEGEQLLAKFTEKGNTNNNKHRCVTLLTKTLLPKQDSIDEEAEIRDETTPQPSDKSGGDQK